MPVLPLVGARSSRPASSSPEASAVSIMVLAIRSLIEPVGFWPSSFAYSRTSPSGRSSTSGVFPISSRRLAAVLSSTGHRGEQDDRGAGADLGVEPVARAHVLALDVDVHEGREVVVLDQLRPERGEAADQVVEQLADGVAVRLDLPLAADLLAERGRDPNLRHAAALDPRVLGEGAQTDARAKPARPDSGSASAAFTQAPSCPRRTRRSRRT